MESNEAMRFWALRGQSTCEGGTWMDSTSKPLLRYRLPYLFRCRFLASIQPKSTTRGRSLPPGFSAQRSCSVLSMFSVFTGGRPDWWRAGVTLSADSCQHTNKANACAVQASQQKIVMMVIQLKLMAEYKFTLQQGCMVFPEQAPKWQQSCVVPATSQPMCTVISVSMSLWWRFSQCHLPGYIFIIIDKNYYTLYCIIWDHLCLHTLPPWNKIMKREIR